MTLAVKSAVDNNIPFADAYRKSGRKSHERIWHKEKKAVYMVIMGRMSQ